MELTEETGVEADGVESTALDMPVEDIVESDDDDDGIEDDRDIGIDVVLMITTVELESGKL